jgi:hypothetical protein
LWLGAVIGRSEKAAQSARVSAFITFAGSSLALQPNFTVPLAFAGVIIFYCLIVQPQSRPRAFQGGVLALVFLLTGETLWQSLGAYQPTLQLSSYSPVIAILSDENILKASLAYLGLAFGFGYLSYRQVLKTV